MSIPLQLLIVKLLERLFFLNYCILLYTFVYMNADNNKPVPIRLGELKPLLQEQAFAEERSLHYWILKILRAHLKQDKKQNVSYFRTMKK